MRVLSLLSLAVAVLAAASLPSRGVPSPAGEHRADLGFPAAQRRPAPAVPHLLSFFNLTPEDDLWWDCLTDALAWVESSHNPSAYNSDERAVGLLQIRPIMVRELQRIDPAGGWHLDDRWDATKSRAMLRAYGEWHLRRAGEARSYQAAQLVARRWNGGHRGDSKAATRAYWRKVLHILTEVQLG